MLHSFGKLPAANALITQKLVITLLVFLPRQPRKDVLVPCPKKGLRCDRRQIVSLGKTEVQNDLFVRFWIITTDLGQTSRHRKSLVASNIDIVENTYSVVAFNKPPARRDQGKRCNNEPPSRFFTSLEIPPYQSECHDGREPGDVIADEHLIMYGLEFLAGDYLLIENRYLGESKRNCEQSSTVSQRQDLE